MSSNRIASNWGFSLEGNLLVASPNWTDSKFNRAVCLILHHDHRGAVGMLLNYSINTPMPGLWKHLAGESTERAQGQILHFGGPQSGPIVAIHDREHFAEFTGPDGVYGAAQIDTLQALVREPEADGPVKIIIGQVAWQAGELEQQFSDGRWLILPVDRRLVFAPTDVMWQLAMRQIGNHFVAAMVGAPGMPADLLCN